MPSPIGHALAGVATAWGAQRSAAPHRFSPISRLTLTCALLAVLPDADLLYPSVHRAFSHSIGAVALVMIIAAAVTGWVTGRPAWRLAIVLAAAYGSHVLLDWLGRDPNPPIGIQALWPFSRNWYIAPWQIFPGTERRHLLSLASLRTNATAAVVEIMIIGPVVLAIGFWRRLAGAGRAGGAGTAGGAGRTEAKRQTAPGT